LEERDVQIRGYKIRLPLDVMLVASANPEDYTNRGRIITPLKDRFGSQIRTHYPLEVATEVAIMRQEARPASIGDVTVTMPKFMEEVIATFSQQARMRPPGPESVAGTARKTPLARGELSPRFPRHWCVFRRPVSLAPHARRASMSNSNALLCARRFALGLLVILSACSTFPRRAARDAAPPAVLSYEYVLGPVLEDAELDIEATPTSKNPAVHLRHVALP
ncbi:MAG: hypothetical protein RL552_709, partial [Actinomycetota bacterium]